MLYRSGPEDNDGSKSTADNPEREPVFSCVRCRATKASGCHKGQFNGLRQRGAGGQGNLGINGDDTQGLASASD
ncbi:hypothetical protein GCM10017712_25240 [Curtobacterium citreum]